MSFVIDTNSSHLTAIRKPESLNLQKGFMERDLERCVRWPYGFSMRMTTFSILKCMQTYISHCVKTPVIKEQREESSYEENRYCGMISLRRDQYLLYLPRFIYVATLNKLAMELDILLFDFTWTRYGCASHGLSISDNATDTSEWFCGKRLPWIIMRLKSKAYIKLNITPFQHFKVKLFYSSQNLTWLKHLTLHHSIHLTHIAVAMAASTLKLIEKYYYYIIANQFDVLLFSDIKVTSSKCKITFYDGPGILSQELITLKKLNKLGFRKITTTSFAAFILLEKLLSTNATIHLAMQSVGNKIAPKRCVRNIEFFRLINFVSTIARTEFCYVGISLKNPLYIKKMNMYFSGFSMATSDSQFNCQYGGLFLRMVRFKNIISICDNRSLYQIKSSDKSVDILIVSYKGYTGFKLTALILELDNCKTHYLDFKTINTKIILEPEFDCVVYVCSSEYLTRGDICQLNVTSEDGEIGSTNIRVHHTPALYSCPVNDYTDTLEYNISLLSSQYWPIAKPKYTKQTGTIGIRRDKYITIDYLYEFNISLPNMCQENSIFDQLAIEIYSLKCNEDEMFPKIYSNVTEINDLCFNKLVTLEYIVNGMSRPIPQTNFIFTETSETDRSYMVDFTYNDRCAHSCRRFMYILKVWREGQRVYEYRSPVGQGIFTGCCHQGFRVTLVPPPPETLINCYCMIYFIGSKFHVDESNIWAHGEQIYHLHEARYAIFLLNRPTLSIYWL